MISIEDWWSAGEQVQVRLGERERTIFCQRNGTGPQMTLLHGFPSSSYDWARVFGELSAHHTLLLFDFLGFGASEKPTDHDYSIHEQADLAATLWEQNGITSTILVAHDYAVSVAQELLARHAEGALRVELVGVHLLNGGLYPDVYRPQPGQLALLDPVQGPQISANINEQLWSVALRPTFAESFDASADLADIWSSMSHDDGHLITHRLIRYMNDRSTHAERWVSALESTDIPLSFIWGMLDSISGAHMAARIRERLPDAPFLALEDVSHWPALEAPARVVEALLSA